MLPVLPAVTPLDSQEIATIVAAFGTVSSAAGVCYVAAQLTDGRRFMKAQLINELEDEYVRHYAIYNRLLPGGDWSPQGCGPTTADEMGRLEAYLEFFEKISIIIDTGALDLRTVDRLYAFRFLIALHNPHAQRLIHRDEPYWGSLIELYRKWVDYRLERGLSIVNAQHVYAVGR